jgi:hypothetical protein
MEEFKTDVAAGNIPAFVWLEPGYFNAPNQGRDIYYFNTLDIFT